MPKRQILTPFTPISIPRPVSTKTAMNVNRNRSQILAFTPNDSVAGRHRLDGIDRFYLKCQKHRDFYKESNGRFQSQFYYRTKRFATRPDPTTIYLKIPTSRYEEHKPVVYPLTMGRRGLNSLKTRFG